MRVGFVLQKALLGGGPGRWEIKPENEHDQFILWGMGKDLEKFGVKMFVGDSDELNSANIISTFRRKEAKTLQKSRTKSEWSQVKRNKKSEYGDETYADPAHNSYPLTDGGKPSRERTMAAWRYAHTERDEDEYTPAERTRLQSRIKRFAKVHFGEDLQSPDEAKKSLRIAFPIAR